MKLSKYFEAVKRSLTNSSSKEEVMKDIEMRVAEILSEKQKSDFWNKVQFGGGFGLNIGSGFTDITLAPNAIYNLNQYISIGAGLQGSIVSQKDIFSYDNVKSI